MDHLPTIYGAFSRREVAVTDLSVRAGTPPKPWEMLERAHLAGYLHEMDRVWESWMTWFTELGETHTSLAVLSFFRSPNPGRSWITASGAVLDAAALRMALLNVEFTPAGGLCIRSGYLALREIAASFGFDFDSNPSPDDPISISREEFDEVYERLAGFVMAPYGPWTSDRSSLTPLVRRSPVRRRAQRVLEVGRRSTTT